MDPINLLYVCTGNSCRSVMAEYLTKLWLKRAGMDQIKVASAGVFAIDGMRASRETEAMLIAVGTSAAQHRAQRVNTQLVREADYIFVMEQFQGEEIARNFPEYAGKVYLLKNFGCTEREMSLDPTIRDPIGKPIEVYEVCFDEIRTAAQRVLRRLGVLAE